MSVRNVTAQGQALASTVECRRADLSSCEDHSTTNLTGDVSAVATFYKKAADTLDFGIDVEDWCLLNGECQIDTAVLAVAADSPTPAADPKLPTVGGALITATKDVVFMFSGGEAGTTVYYDLTLTTKPVKVNGADGVEVPARVIVRRFHMLIRN